MQTEDQSAIIAFLSEPKSHGMAGAVARHQTHGSIVFLAGDRAYKLKRAVKYPYMDYSTCARRKAMCEAELAVNRRLAPEIYLGVTPVRRRSDGTLAIGGEDGEVCDWLVVMRRFGQDALLESARARGGLDPGLMRALGERIARFHGEAERRHDFGGADAIAAVIAENAELLAPLAGAPFDPERLARLDRLTRESLARLTPRLDRRRADGFVRRCHGDLHLNNICLFEGRPVPFDAIEFQDSFVFIDVFYDLAFLLMDLDRHGLRRHANGVLNRYLELTGDHDGLALLPLFLSCRAALRAHLQVTMAGFDAQGLTDDVRAASQHLLDCAISYLEPQPRLAVAIGGPSGTGKSTLAAALAPGLGRAPGAVVLRSDVIRKSLAGVDALTRLPEKAYAPAMTARVYGTICEQARAALAAGHSVIADAVFGLADERAQLAAVASETGTGFFGVWLAAPDATLGDRLDSRVDDASDATRAVLHRQLRIISSPPDWVHLDAARAPDAVLDEAVRGLASASPPGGEGRS